MKFQRVFSSIAVISCGLLFMGGCPPTPDDDDVEGYLVDSPISGANYECVEGGMGLTDEKGKFKCKNIPVTFKIGGLELGTISSLADDKKVYPQDLVGVSRENYSDDRLILLTRFLQSLDDDGVISTNIEITKELREKFTIGEFSDLSEEELKTLLGKVGKGFVGQEQALSHLRGNIDVVDDDPILTPTPPNNSNQNWTPVTTKLSCSPKIIYDDEEYRSTEMKIYASGDIEANCLDVDNNKLFAGYKFKNGVDSLEIVQIVGERSIVMKSNRGSIQGITTYDYKEGTIGGKGTSTLDSDIKQVECVSKYKSILPTKIGAKVIDGVIDNETAINLNSLSITNLLSWIDDVNEQEALSTTCPENEDINDTNDSLFFDMKTNYTLTDSNNKKHFLTIEMKNKKVSESEIPPKDETISKESGLSYIDYSDNNQLNFKVDIEGLGISQEDKIKVFILPYSDQNEKNPILTPIVNIEERTDKSFKMRVEEGFLSYMIDTKDMENPNQLQMYEIIGKRPYQGLSVCIKKATKDNGHEVNGQTYYGNVLGKCHFVANKDYVIHSSFSLNSISTESVGDKIKVIVKTEGKLYENIVAQYMPLLGHISPKKESENSFSFIVSNNLRDTEHSLIVRTFGKDGYSQVARLDFSL